MRKPIAFALPVISILWERVSWLFRMGKNFLWVPPFSALINKCIYTAHWGLSVHIPCCCYGCWYGWWFDFLNLKIIFLQFQESHVLILKILEKQRKAWRKESLPSLPLSWVKWGFPSVFLPPIPLQILAALSSLSRTILAGPVPSPRAGFSYMGDLPEGKRVRLRNLCPWFSVRKITSAEGHCSSQDPGA